jgi:hypothetical protein
MFYQESAHDTQDKWQNSMHIDLGTDHRKFQVATGALFPLKWHVLCNGFIQGRL